MNRTRVVGLGLAAVLPLSGLVACSAGSSGPGGRSGTSITPSAAPAAASTATASTIPQPDVADLRVAPDSDRVDLAMPRFSDPTNITNPLFPVSAQASVLLLGTVDEQAFRTEVTLLDNTRVIAWEGRQVEVLVSQYVAFLGGRIQEVAYDLYAQDDDGNVWYFGEDVYNFEDGVIADTHGTWIAGVDGPAAMIMPATPAVGDVYRPENVPGLVFEEVTVTATDRPFRGPFDAGTGAVLISELHPDGVTEAKTFAPGYGEFFTGASGDVEALALAVPTDRASGSLPAPIGRLDQQALAAYDASMQADWHVASRAVADVKAARGGVGPGDVPRLLAKPLNAAVARLDRAVQSQHPRRAAQASIDLARTATDLRLRYQPTQTVDLARMDLWLAQMLLDARSRDFESLRGDFFSIDYIRDRVRPDLDQATRVRLDTGLEALLDAISEEDQQAVTKIATELRTTLSETTP